MKKMITVMALWLSTVCAQSTNIVPTQRQLLNQLWLVTMIDENGDEVVVTAPSATGQDVPLIAADAARRDSMITPARYIAKGKGIKLYLIKLSERTLVEEIAP